MHGRLVLVLLLFSSLAAAMPMQQSQRLLEDPAGDTVVPGTPVFVPRGSMDLRYLEIEETLEHISFKLGTQPNTGHADQGQINVWFRHEDSEFRLNLQQRNMVSGWYWLYFLHRVEADGQLSIVAQSVISEPLAEDEAAGWVRADLRRADLADRSGAIPFAGRALEDIWAESISYSFDVLVRDRMPDIGQPSARFVFALGPLQEGDVEMWSPSPGRASNGEATTMIYEVAARNKGDQGLSLRFEVEKMPEDWQVTFPTPTVELAAGQTATLPVLVQTTFEHEHGRVATVDVALRSGDHVGRASLSVIYHAVPQPAGHHDTLWFHTDRSPDGRTAVMHATGLVVWHRLYMNAVEEFDGDDRVAVPARSDGRMLVWELPLDPALQMGIDFDLGREGTLSIPLRADVDVPAAVVSGTIRLEEQDASGQPVSVVVAQIEPTQPQDIGPTTVTVEAVVRPTAAGDLMPYREGANLILTIELQREGEWLGTGPEKPHLLPGGWLRLPLHEYHDPVVDVFKSLQGVSLVSVGPQQRPVNPGETVTFQAELAYDGPAAAFLLGLQGRDAGTASVAAQRVMVGDGATHVTVAVQAPADARDGTFLDVVLVAQKEDDPAVQGLLRLVADVDTEVDHPDEFLAADEAKESPIAWPLAALAVAALGARRRDSGPQC